MARGKQIKGLKCDKSLCFRKKTEAFGPSGEIRCPDAAGHPVWCCRRPAVGKGQSTGLPHFYVRISRKK